MHSHDNKYLKRNIVLGIIALLLVAFGALWKPLNAPSYTPPPFKINT